MSNQRWDTVVTPQRPLVAPWRRPQVPQPEQAPPTPATVTSEGWERTAIEILERPIVNESAAAGHARKEAELKVVFATLTVAESRALHARLVRPGEGDELARLVGRMVAERRARLIAYVADARRREAISVARAAEAMAKCG